MTAFFFYLAKSSICLLMLWFLYHILLKGTTFFKLQRLVLMCGSIACLALPFAKMDTGEVSFIPRPAAQQKAATPVGAPVFFTDELAPQQEATIITAEEEGKNYEAWISFASGLLLAIYLYKCAILLLQRGKGYWQLAQLIRRADKRREKGVTWCLTDEEVNPCSWGRYAIMSRKDYKEHPLIALHEQTHVKLCHSADIVFMQLLTTVFWFNPAVWFLSHELGQCHEFQVDHDVCLQSGRAKQYKLLLTAKAVGPELFAMASRFSQPSLKERLDMISREESPKWKMWLTLLLLPVGTGLAYAFSLTEAKQEIEIPVAESQPALSPAPVPLPEKQTKPQAQPSAPAETETSRPEETPTEEKGTTEEDSQEKAPADSQPETDGKKGKHSSWARYLTCNEYQSLKGQVPFITLYIDDNEHLRLQDTDGAFHPTAYHSFDGDIAVLMRKAFSQRYRNQTPPFAPGLHIVASADEQHSCFASVQQGLHSIFHFSAKEMELEYPEADVSSLTTPLICWDIPELENLQVTRADYKTRHPLASIKLREKEGITCIQMENFTGEELEEAIGQFLRNNPDAQLQVNGYSYSLWDGEKNLRTYFKLIEQIMGKYNLTLTKKLNY